MLLRQQHWTALSYQVRFHGAIFLWCWVVLVVILFRFGFYFELLGFSCFCHPLSLSSWFFIETTFPCSSSLFLSFPVMMPCFPLSSLLPDCLTYLLYVDSFPPYIIVLFIRYTSLVCGWPSLQNCLFSTLPHVMRQIINNVSQWPS